MRPEADIKLILVKRAANDPKRSLEPGSKLQQEGRTKLDGEPVAELLDQDEYPSNIGNVAAISNRQVCVLRRDRHKLTHFKLEYLDVRECRAIEYRKEMAYYRIIAAGACFVAALVFVFMLGTGLDDNSANSAPMIIVVIALVSLGVRFVTSIHRHIIRFEMPDETLVWRSPTIDFKSKVGAARAVCEYARKRGILRETKS